MNGRDDDDWQTFPELTERREIFVGSVAAGAPLPVTAAGAPLPVTSAVAVTTAGDRHHHRNLPILLDLKGTLWIHAAGKVPDKDTIKAVEEFYKQLYAFEGVTDLKFPERYPLQVLVGCVEVVGCIEREELESWDDVSQGVRLEALHDFCWLCEDPQKLIVNWETRGYPGIFNLEEKVLWAAERSLGPIEAPLPIKFPELVYDDSEHSEDTLSSTPGSPVDGVDVKGSKKCKLDEDVPPARSEDTLSSTPGSPVDGIDMDLKESKPDEDVAPAHSEDTLSSTPGSPVDGIDMDSKESKADKELPPALKAALEGVRAIVGQFSKKPDYPPTGSNW